MSADGVLPQPIFQLALPSPLDRSGVALVETWLAVTIRRLDDERMGIVAQRSVHEDDGRLVTIRVRRTGGRSLTVDIVDTRPDLARLPEFFDAVDTVNATAAALALSHPSPAGADSQRPLRSLRAFARREPGWIRGVDPAHVVSDLVPDRVGERLPEGALKVVKSGLIEDLESGTYAPTPMQAVEHPKPRGGSRPAAVLRYSDRLVYAALVDSCRDPIDATLRSSDQVLWPRGRVTPMRWAEFETFVERSGTPYVLAADIQSFYDSIDHGLLQEHLVAAGCSLDRARPLCSLLTEISGRAQGLPQGLPPSDPLATLMLTPVDNALVNADLKFVRHGDDFLIAVDSAGAAREAEGLLREQFRSLELPINDEKTRTLHRETFLARRQEVSRAVELYLHADDGAKNTAVHHLLTALDADEDLQWAWYHGNLRVDELLDDVGGSIQPGDEQALLILLDQVAGEQLKFERWRAERRDPAKEPSLGGSGASFLLQASLGLLAEAKSELASNLVPVQLIGRPEYTNALAAYVEQLAHANPAVTADLLTSLESTGVPYDSQWLRLYAALRNEGKSGEFDPLAGSHAAERGREDILRLRAANFLADHGRPPATLVDELYETAPPALRDESLHLIARAQPDRLTKLLAGESRASAALARAAA